MHESLTEKVETRSKKKKDSSERAERGARDVPGPEELQSGRGKCGVRVNQQGLEHEGFLFFFILAVTPSVSDKESLRLEGT